MTVHVPSLDPETLAPPPAPAGPAYDTPPVVEGGAPRILLVDDEAMLQLAFSRFFRACGYEVETAGGVEEAVECVRRTRFALVLCDVCMPGASGVELVGRVTALDPDLGVLMLSGLNDAAAATAALQRGAYDYLVKPVALSELHAAAERALQRRELAVERRRVDLALRAEVEAAARQREHDRATLDAFSVGLAATLINAMEAKDVYLRGHSQRVASLAAAVAEEMGLDADTVEAVRLAGRLHDVGKIGIREGVLNKPGRLEPDEVAHVQDHVRIGMEILEPLRHLGPVLDYVHDHHERWSGDGYPRGLAREEISIGGRILAAADAFDALTSRRAYRDSMPHADTVVYLGGQSGTMLDPRVYEALRAVVVRGQSVSLSFIDELHG
jgi:putative nucleotidyltransferase with HDIG domain